MLPIPTLKGGVDGDVERYIRNAPWRGGEERGGEEERIDAIGRAVAAFAARRRIHTRRAQATGVSHADPTRLLLTERPRARLSPAAWPLSSFLYTLA